jgi:hypothetical protein
LREVILLFFYNFRNEDISSILCRIQEKKFFNAANVNWVSGQFERITNILGR